MKAMIENGIKFAELSDCQEAFLEGMEFDSMVVSSREIKLTAKALGLYGKSGMELTEIRNSVVKYLGDKSSHYRKLEAWDTYDQMRNNMSAVTAVIDHYIYAA